MQDSKQGTDRRMVISTAWIFIVLNYLYGDVLVLMGEVKVTNPEEVAMANALLSPDMLLYIAIFLEMAILMTVLSRVLKYGLNRWTNIIIATLHIIGNLFTLYFTLENSAILFLTAEVSALVFIVWYAWTWPEPQRS
jgi:hypothetical protein